jgi:hypothetical protein
MNEMNLLRRLFKPLKSRKVRVALVTVIVAFAAEYGLEVSPALLMTILGLGVSVILGIAHEDNGQKANPNVTMDSLDAALRRRHRKISEPSVKAE